MTVIQDVIRGALKVNQLPERACYRTWQEFIEGIPNFLSVEVPASVGNVVIGNMAPTEDDVNKLWFRRSASGTFLGLYAFQDGSWKPIYAIPLNEVVWMFGNSTQVPAGFILIDTGDSLVPPAVVAALKSQYVSAGSGVFSYYAARYVAF